MAEINNEQQNNSSICCICHKMCKHKQVLPCCQSVTCKSCLKEWIETQDVCPYCKSRFRKPNTCKIHHKNLDYYCETCNQYLCSDCLLEQYQSENAQHKGHNIVEASKISNSNKIKKNLKQEDIPFENLENHLKSLISFSEKLDKQIENLQQQKSLIPTMKFNALSQAAKSFNKFESEIESLYTEKQQDYKKISDSLEEQMFNLQSVLEESELILTSNDPKVVPSAQDNIDKIKQMQKGFNPISPKPPNTEFPNKLCPPSQSFNVTIPDFQKCLSDIRNSTAENDFIFSDEKKLFKFLWRAKIFPNGTQSGKGTHLAVYVELLKGDQTPTSFAYQVEIISKKEKYLNITRNYTSDFQPMDSWGWNKIVSINTLIAGYLDEKGALSLTISLRPSSYTVCIQLNKCIYDKISKECKKLKNDIEKFSKSKKKDIKFDDNGNLAHNEM